MSNIAIGISTYEQSAINFLTATNTKFKATFLKYGLHFADDKQSRDIYKCTLKNSNGSYTFNFGQSINNSGRNIAPTAYDVLTCLTKYDPGSFEDFCGDFGYEAFNDEYTGHNKKSMKIYKAVCKEWENIDRLFSSEEIEQLKEIQ